MRGTSVPTILLTECSPIDRGVGSLIFKDLVPAPARHHLPGLSTPQVLVQFENEHGDLVELTVPETVALIQTVCSPPGSPTRKALFAQEAGLYVTDKRHAQVHQLARLLKDFEEGKEVFGVRLPPKGAGRDEARRRFGKELEQAGHQGVSVAGQHRMRTKLQAHGWDATVLFTADDLSAPDDPLACEDPSLVERAREFMTGRTTYVELTVPVAVREFEIWLRDTYGKTTSEAGYSGNACRRVFGALAGAYLIGSDVGRVDSKQARPKGVQGRLTASLPYEGLQIDAWTIDCLALDQYGKAIRLFLLTAIDSRVRKLRALRICAHEPTMQDIKLLIFDTVKGTPIWPVGEPTCPRLPDFVELGENLVGHLIRENPGFKPTGMIHVDNGSAMIGSEALAAAGSVGIHVQAARPGRGSDKGGVESFFRTLARFARRLPGAVGSKSTKRPRNVLRLLSVQHLEIFLRLWVEVAYHDRPHSGLQDPRFPNRALSPNAFEQHLLLTHGTIAVSTHPFAAVGLLPLTNGGRHVAHDEGFRNRNRDYDAEGTERLKEYTQGSAGVGYQSRAVAVYEHPLDADAIIVRNINGDLLVLPHRDLAAPEPPLTDEGDRNLRELLLMPAPVPTASDIDKRVELIVAAARDLGQPMPKRTARTTAAAVEQPEATDAAWARSLKKMGA